MREAVILSACRTPIGKFLGSLSTLSAAELGAVAVRSAFERAGVAPDDVDEVIMGNVLSAGVGQAPARQAALKAGLPPTVAALTVNKVCGSGLKAVMLAAQAVRCGDADVVVAGGMESMSRAPYLLAREGSKLGDRELTDSMLADGLTCAFGGCSMGEIAESLARGDGVSREDQDRFAVESHRRAVRAAEEGAFAGEIVPVTLRTRKDEVTVARDEGPRSDTTPETLSRLRPAFQGGETVTAGNASMISDGAAAVVVTSAQWAAERKLKPMARIVASTTAGARPEDLFIAPVAAVRQVLEKTGRRIDDIDLFEINEAFAAQMLACVRRLELPPDRLNVDGGAIALGHPIGASGARVLVTLLHALKRRSRKTGVASLCLGGGNAVAMLVEAV
jgi:acetyl-CoA C-acetyltransferase